MLLYRPTISVLGFMCGMFVAATAPAWAFLGGACGPSAGDCCWQTARPAVTVSRVVSVSASAIHSAATARGTPSVPVTGLTGSVAHPIPTVLVSPSAPHALAAAALPGLYVATELVIRLKTLAPVCRIALAPAVEMEPAKAVRLPAIARRIALARVAATVLVKAAKTAQAALLIAVVRQT